MCTSLIFLQRHWLLKRPFLYFSLECKRITFNWQCMVLKETLPRHEVSTLHPAKRFINSSGRSRSTWAVFDKKLTAMWVSYVNLLKRCLDQIQSGRGWNKLYSSCSLQMSCLLFILNHRKPIAYFLSWCRRWILGLPSSQNQDKIV